MSPDVVPPAPIAIDLSSIHRDADRDGWTDFEERQLGLNPASADSHGDGLSDGADSTLLHAPAASDSTDDDVLLLRQAWFAMYGVRGSRYALFVPRGLRPMQLQGLSGPVFFGIDLPSRVGCGRGSRKDCSPIRGGAETRWTIVRRSDNHSTVEFTNYLGAGFMSAARLELRTIDGFWVVVSYGLARIT
jgi:hypothetical protein